MSASFQESPNEAYPTGEVAQPAELIDAMTGQPNALSDDQLLRIAMRKFQASVDHSADFHAEAHRALRFYHNSELIGSWEKDDVSYLREQGRPVMVFNITKSRTDDFLGFYADAERKAEVRGTGGEDQLAAEVVNAATDEVMKQAKGEENLARTLSTGTVAGECALQVEVQPDEENPNWIQVRLNRILPFELHWDASSIEPDRSDARCVFWHRWLSEEEFLEAYPEHPEAFKMTSAAYSSDTQTDTQLWSEGGNGGAGDYRGDYDDQTSGSHYYYDRYRDMVRVIRYEYKTYETGYLVRNMMTGESTLRDASYREQIEFAQMRGMPIEVETTRIPVVKGFEFIGSQILRKFDKPGPFRGFSICSYSYAMDEETGTPYGFVRNLFDPQMELNKAKSLDIEHAAQQVALGTVSEKSAINNREAFMDELRRPGGDAVVEDDALAEGRVQIRNPSPPNPVAAKRATDSVQLINEISNIPGQANITPGEAQQAGVTLAIRYNKTRQSVARPFANFEAMQLGIVERIVQTIVRAMPDDQLNHMLASSKYQIANGAVYEIDQNTGQPVGMAELRDVRTMRHNLDFEYSSQNNTLRLITLQTLQELQASGLPVDPEVMVELATSSRSIEERLKAYVEKMQTSQEQMAQAEAQANQQQVQMLAQLEAQKNQETQRSNMADEQLTAWRDRATAANQLAATWEKAEGDAEKRRLEFWMKRRQAQTP